MWQHEPRRRRQQPRPTDVRFRGRDDDLRRGRNGFDVDGQHLPLNPDAWFLHTLGSPNTPPLNASFGSLDASGRAHASIDVPAGTSPTLAGLELHHAFVSLDLSTVPGAAVVSLASNAVPLELVP